MVWLYGIASPPLSNCMTLFLEAILMQDGKISSIQGLRLFLAVLVVVHHLACTYGGPNVWYYQENTKNPAYFALLTLFIAVNQSFFMGLFFLISSYFAPKSIHVKGSLNYILTRALRLGLPLFVFYYVISPATVFMAVDKLRNGPTPLWRFLLSFDGTGAGPLWFLAALMIFSFSYALGSTLKRKLFGPPTTHMKMPKDATILLVALITGVLTFIVRLWFPVCWVLPPFDFQLSHFLQYIVMFWVGTAAYRGQWLAEISMQRASRWFWVAQLAGVVIAPVIMYLGGGLSGHYGPFYGGWHWQSLAYSIWEQIVGFSLIMGLLGLFQHRSWLQTKWISSISESTYALFFIHAPILVGLCICVQSVRLDPFYKFCALVPVAILVGIPAALGLRKIPFVNKVM